MSNEIIVLLLTNECICTRKCVMPKQKSRSAFYTFVESSCQGDIMIIMVRWRDYIMATYIGLLSTSHEFIIHALIFLDSENVILF